MLQLLHAAGANIHAVNGAGANARSRCKQSSGSTVAFLNDIKVGYADRKYPPDVHRGARQGQSQVVCHHRLNANQHTMSR